MATMRVCVDLADAHFRALSAEAERQGVQVEALVQRMVQGLVRELEREEREGTDVPAILS